MRFTAFFHARSWAATGPLSTPAAFSIAPQPCADNPDQRKREAIPGDGILQMIVRKVDDGHATDGQATGIGRAVGIDGEWHHPAKVRQAALSAIAAQSFQ